MKEIKGDLIALAKAGEFDVIVHGCNCFCTMGAGIAKSIRANFVKAYMVDQKTAYGNVLKLGTITTYFYVQPRPLVIVNAYTQYDFNGPNNVDYLAIKHCFQKIKTTFPGKRIGYPKIGAGLAGGNWDIISSLIDKELEEEDHTVVIWDK